MQVRPVAANQDLSHHASRREAERERRAMIVGVVPGGFGEPGQPPFLVAGRHLTRGHYEAVADVMTGFRLGEQVRIRRNLYTIVG
jgi:putative ABC transport system permease protein